MANWGEPIPEHPSEMRLLDWCLIVALAIIAVAVGVVAAGGPN